MRLRILHIAEQYENWDMIQSNMLSIQIAMVCLLLTSCSKKQEAVEATDCTEPALNKNLKYQDIIEGLDNELLLQTAEQPDQNGALSRNKAGYFSVRSQMNMSKLADVAIHSKRVDALHAYRNALAYAFEHQNANGSFKLSLPESMKNNNDIGLPTEGDSVSAIAFFSYALSISLTALNDSDWYNSSPETNDLKYDIEAYRPKIDKTLNHLIDHELILKQVDAKAPNRLLFDAIAFYGLGTYAGHKAAKSLGIEFLNRALNLINEEDGYFIENGGWDSSYNGVALKLGLELFTLLPPSHPVKDELGKKLACAAKWQESRILPDGEISTKGNTRVYPGGESFLGNEKRVDVEKTVRAFCYISVFADDKAYKKLAESILARYDH